jgi:hypothetical protein
MALKRDGAPLTQVLQRPDWTGEPLRIGATWTFRKGRRTAECVLWTHQLGWELRLVSGSDLLRSQVCRTQDEVLDTYEQWKAAMIEKGWS